MLSGIGPYFGLMTRPEESYRVSFVKMSVVVKPRKWGSSGPLGDVVPWKKINIDMRVSSHTAVRHVLIDARVLCQSAVQSIC